MNSVQLYSLMHDCESSRGLIVELNASIERRCARLSTGKMYAISVQGICLLFASPYSVSYCLSTNTNLL